mmetsp:Transcript_47201/g.125381  ORF Transcript_47201/g.125381 Transcript_47201/m.125381 type:complete len:87 (-) Transcript_47201:1048-1308(-)
MSDSERPGLAVDQPFMSTAVAESLRRAVCEPGRGGKDASRAPVDFVVGESRRSGPGTAPCIFTAIEPFRFDVLAVESTGTNEPLRL